MRAWLLPDDKHVIVESSDIATAEQKGKPQRTIATVALVKANNADRQTGKGQLLLFGPSERQSCRYRTTSGRFTSPH